MEEEATLGRLAIEQSNNLSRLEASSNKYMFLDQFYHFVI